MAVTDKAYYVQLGRRIAERRKALGMNQTELAEVLGISQQTMANYEAGIVRVAIAMLPTLAQTLGLTIEELIGADSRKVAKAAPKKRGPAPKIQQQLERLSALPKAKQRVIVQVLDSMLAQAGR
jgi:transcriptional regulator with XRE-family HTH domain